MLVLSQVPSWSSQKNNETISIVSGLRLSREAWGGTEMLIPSQFPSRYPS